jgi:hypothetical protein
MSDHRRHYLDLNPAPGMWAEEVTPRGPIYFPDWVLVILLLVVLCFSALAMHLKGDPPVITPVRTPQAQHYPLRAIEDARIEGYHAGYSDAIAAQGCRRPVLLHPIQPL